MAFERHYSTFGYEYLPTQLIRLNYNIETPLRSVTR